MFRKGNYIVVELLFCTTFTTNLIWLSSCDRLSNDEIKVPGLYEGFGKVQSLNTANFEKEVFVKQRNKLWLVEFYKHWCGDCMRFVPVIKSLAFDIYGWRDTVAIGVIDCANKISIDICAKEQVKKVPALKIFHPNSDKNSMGISYGEEGKGITYTALRQLLIQKLKQYQNNQVSIYGSVNLKPLTGCNLNTLWNMFPQNVEYLLLVFEDKDSLIGSQVALDLSETPEVRVRLVNPSNVILYQKFDIKQGNPGAILLKRYSSHSQPQSQFSELVPIDQKQCSLPTVYFHVKTANLQQNRETLNRAVRELLRSHNVDIAPDLPTIPIFSTKVTFKQKQQAVEKEDYLLNTLKVNSLTAVVIQMDLEAAIDNVFTQEVPLTSHITGETLLALKSFVNVLWKYFPTGGQGRTFFKLLKEVLDTKDMIQGKGLQKMFVALGHIYSPFSPNSQWVGCRGTLPQYRGYPCSLWSTFHTLVALEELKDRSDPYETPEVLSAMAGYIRYFFSCKTCSDHFDVMAQTIAGNVTTQRDAVMWLWRAHNKVNHRLAGDVTEDPRHPKVPFPPLDLCPVCYNGDGSWNEAQVFEFLSNKYTNPVYINPYQNKTTCSPVSSDCVTIYYT